MMLILSYLAALLIALVSVRLAVLQRRRVTPSVVLGTAKPIACVRVLRDDREVEEAAARAQAREQLLANAAAERAARLEALTTPQDRFRFPNTTSTAAIRPAGGDAFDAV
jgi:hypothetical protein